MAAKKSKADSDAPATAAVDDAAPWEGTVGTKRGDIVTAYERPDKRGVVYLRWTDPSTGKYAKRSTGLVVRDKTGRRVQAAIKRALDAAEAQQGEVRAQRRALQRGELPTTQGAESDTSVRAAEPEAPADFVPVSSGRARIELSLRAGIVRALRLGDGIYSVPSNHARDMAKSLRRALTVLDPSMLWGDITAGTYRDLWRRLFKAYAHSASLLEAERKDAERAKNAELSKRLANRLADGGFRSTEMSVIAMVRVARWLEDEQRVVVGATRPPSEWRKALKRDWEAFVPAKFQVPNRRLPAPTPSGQAPAVIAGDRMDEARYTEVEAGRLLNTMVRADPRLRLAFELGGEGRLGQVTRSTRSHLRLGDGAGVLGFGHFKLHGRGTKSGVDVDLDQQQRAVVEHELSTGFLAEFEAGYQAGKFDDYLLLPGGRLVLGRARADSEVPMDDRTLNDLWRKLEKLAGVDYVPARGFYGYRRIATDIAEDLTNEHRVLNALFGPTPQDTRRKTYQRRDREEIAIKVAELRRQLRDHFIAAAAATGFSLADVPEPEPLKVAPEQRRGPKPRKGSRGWRKQEPRQ